MHENGIRAWGAKSPRLIWSWLKTGVLGAASWSHRLYMLEAASTVLVAMMFFTNYDSPARTFYVTVVLPLGGLSFFSEAARKQRFSWVLVACLLHLVAMLGASIADLGQLNHDIWEQFYLSVYVFAFLWIIAARVPAHRQFIAQFFFFAGTAAGVSAALNSYLFLENILPADAPFYRYRLLTTIGMPAYANATNMGATYAVFFLGTLAVVLRGDLSARARAILCIPVGLLLFGLLLTQSRGGFAAVAAGLVVLSLTGSPRFRRVTLGVFVLLAAMALTIPQIQAVILERGLSDRPEVWGKFIDLIAQRPWIGYGSFNPIGIVVGDDFLDQAHNLVLSAWFRGGGGSALAMLLVLLGGLYWAWRCWVEVKQIVPLCVMVTITTASMVDYQLLATVPTWPWVTFWLPFGLGAGAEMLVRRHREGASSDRARDQAGGPGDSVHTGTA